MSKYDYSKPINLWLTSDTPAFNELVQAINYEVKVELQANHGVVRFKSNETLKALRHILADLFVTASCDPMRYLAFTKNKNWFSPSADERYELKRFAYGPFTNTIAALGALGYIDLKDGYYDKGGANSRNSRMRATAKLLKLFGEQKFTSIDFYQCVDRESIVLKSPKDSKGRSEKINYKDTPESIKMRENLRQINENIKKHWVDIKITDAQFDALQEKLSQSKNQDKSPIDFSRTSLYRIFNNGDLAKPEFNQGGRFYGGWWLSIPSEFRSRITIDNKKTVEVDYSAMHFHMMYAEKGLEVPDGDLYEVDGLERKKVKLALNTALNADNKTKAIIAIKRDIWQEWSKDKVAETLDLLINKHNAIADLFFSGKGVHLQYRDSLIAESIMLNVWREYGVLVLPVHDSFIIQAGFLKVLNAQMKNSFLEIVKSSPLMVTKGKTEALKSNLEKLSQSVVIDDAGRTIKAGVNAADTWKEYKKENEIYAGYSKRLADINKKHN